MSTKREQLYLFIAIAGDILLRDDREMISLLIVN